MAGGYFRAQPSRQSAARGGSITLSKEQVEAGDAWDRNSSGPCLKRFSRAKMGWVKRWTWMAVLGGGGREIGIKRCREGVIDDKEWV
jgi:hypothetical protein